MEKFKLQSNVKGELNFCAQFDSTGIRSKMNIECKGSFTKQEFQILIALLIAKFSEHISQQMVGQWEQIEIKATKNN